MPGALDGVLVLALEQAVAAPFCTAKIADAGARVIKIERAEGDFARQYDKLAAGMCSFFVWLNRGKESLVLDIKDRGDAALLRRIAQRADIFIQNLLPGAATRAGVGSAQLRALKPRLITCDITGYGDEGPYHEMKAYDLLVQAESGIASISGGPEAPGRTGVSVCDLTTGANAYAAILEAVIRRDRTGEGSALSLSLFDSMVDLMTPQLLQTEAGKEPPRIGFSHTSIAPYGAYQTSDGPIVIAVQNSREWAAFCATVLRRAEIEKDPRLASNVLRCENRAALNEVIDGVFATLTRAEVARRLNDAGIAFGNLNSCRDVLNHPQWRRLPVNTPGGEVRVSAPPHRIAGRAHTLGDVPAIGAHSASIRREFSA